MRPWLAYLALNLACFLSCAVLAFAEPLVRYQGQAVDAAGVPLEGPYDLAFRLYPAETGGTPLWEEVQPAVPLTHGLFSVLLGQQTSLASVDWSQPLWLSVQVNADPELAPRQRITHVPLAVQADKLRDQTRLMPSGAVLFFDAQACPAGWSSLASAEGRYLVGRPPGGVVGAAVGTPLGNQENRPTGTHSHQITDPGHSHTYPVAIAGQTSGSPKWHPSVWGASDLNWTPIRDISNESTGITVQDSAGVAGTNAPYLQLLVCRKD